METGPASQDIILYDNTAQHKSQKIMYILLAFLCIAIVVLTIFVIATQVQRPNSAEDIGNYYYYLMTGDAKTGELSESTVRNPYAKIMIHSNNQEEYEKFYNTAGEMLEQLKKRPHDENLDGVFELQLTYLDLFRFNNWVMSENSSGLIDLSISGDSTEKKELAARIDAYINSEDELVKSYATLAKDMIGQASRLVGYYRSVGCDGKSANELIGCKVDKNEKYRIANYYNGIEAGFTEMKSVVDSMLPVFLESARSLTEKGALSE